MMPQRTKPKLSSRGSALLQRYRSGKATLQDLIADVFALEEFMAVIQYPVRREVLIDLANSRGAKGVHWFWQKWKEVFRPEATDDLIELGNDLRRIWNFYGGEESANDGDDPTRILSSWLVWRPKPEQLESYRNWRRLDQDVEKRLGLHPHAYEYTPFFCSIPTGNLVPDPNCLRAMLIKGVFEHWRHFSYCANADCQAPYFVAKRVDQTVCDAEICKAERQREHARKWWNQNRAKKARNQERTVSKTAKKESKGNVTRKAQ